LTSTAPKSGVDAFFYQRPALPYGRQAEGSVALLPTGKGAHGGVLFPL
jgi:hypothetical protein